MKCGLSVAGLLMGLILAACTRSQPKVAPVVAPQAPVAASAPQTEQSEAVPSLFPPSIHSEGTIAEQTDATVMRAIALRIRQHLVLPKGRLRRGAKAQVTVLLTPTGAARSARISKSSGNAAFDRAVLRAVAQSQPLPVLPLIRRIDRPLPVQLVFSP